MAASDHFVVPYDTSWPKEFAVLGARIRAALGPLALRIDHIGSTSIPGLAAKPIIDVQVSVASLEPLDAYRLPLERCGLVWKNNPDRIKRLFVERPGERRVHVHVARTGSFIEQFHLLFRDYLRLHPARAAEYAGLKLGLAPLWAQQEALGKQSAPGAAHPQPYTEAKGPFIWETVRRAYEWSFDSGWEPGPSDA